MIERMNQKVKLEFCSDLAVQNTAKGPTLTELRRKGKKYVQKAFDGWHTSAYDFHICI